MKVSEKLQKRIKDELGIRVELPVKIPRGRHQASAGQWAWYAKIKGGSHEVGSEDTMTACVSAKALSTHRPPWPCAPLNINAESDLEIQGEK